MPNTSPIRVPATSLPHLLLVNSMTMGGKLKLALLFIIMFSTTEARPEPPVQPPITEAILHGIAASLTMFVDELEQMPKLYGYSFSNGLPVAGSLTIGMFEKHWKFHRDFPGTTVFAYGTSQESATVPGPTIEALQGVPTSITWQNHLPQHHILPWDPTIPTAVPKKGGVPTVVHLHGGVHESKNDGHPLAWFTSDFQETGSAWSGSEYHYPNIQHPGNLWYHDHALGLTRANLLAGLVGPYVIRNPHVETSLDLPSGEEFDQHLVLFDRSFRTDGSLYMNSTGDNPSIHPQWQPEFFGDAIIVNGKAWPYLKVQRRKYRFRIINSGNARYYGLSLSNGLDFISVGSDSSYLPTPVNTNTLLLAPSEIADVIIDFSTSSANEAFLSNDAPYPYPTGNAVDGLNGKVMKFIISPRNPNPPDNSKIPASLINYPAASTSVGITTKTRYIVMYEYQSATGNPTHLYINGKRFEDPVTETPKTGSTELWEVINLTGDNHPLHVHLGTIQAIRVRQIINLTIFTNCMTINNDAIKCNVSAHAIGKLIDIPAYERTWKNVVKMRPGYMTSVIVNFHLIDTNASYPFDATTEPGYVYHCHILDHEDNAMIRPLKLVS
ncbi:multicopper oxidase LPR1 homolog 1-like [Tasmannia lanceolata]|uniref:multicopper oxidase LPR1 homolog 1-like n=1 Tax=Tasmannia lanceolata TaxID=3420 RepID=UPI0040630257